MKLLRRNIAEKKKQCLRRRESQEVTKLIVRNYISKTQPLDTIFIKVINENEAVVHGVECDEQGVVIWHPNNPKRKLERLIWKDAIKRRKVLK